MLPTSLEILDISGEINDQHKFTRGIPPEWGALTNLKQLKMAFCGLDGAFGSTRTERLRNLLTFTFSAGELPKELGKLANLTFFNAAGNKLQGGLSTRTERLRMFADLFLPLSIQGSYPRSSANLSV